MTVRSDGLFVRSGAGYPAGRGGRGVLGPLDGLRGDIYRLRDASAVIGGSRSFRSASVFPLPRRRQAQCYADSPLLGNGVVQTG